MKEYLSKIPPEVTQVTKVLHEAGFEAYLIGGCVRDLLLHKKPKDWDVTTNAKPDTIVALFANTFYENIYGTVGVVNEQEGIDPTLNVVEVTPYRLEAKYSDNRRPDDIIFSDKLEDDLKRRDFTINAIALDSFKGHVVDLFEGQKDIKDKILKTVGDADARFQEDALRIVRAVRLSCELDFHIEDKTEQALIKNAHLLANISKERIRDEFVRIIMSHNPQGGLELARKYKVLRFISPELEASIGIDQGGIHKYDVWEHLIRSVQHAADKGWTLEVRLAALFHDIGKPPTRRAGVKNDKWSFYGHEVVGARMAKKILNDLKFPQKTVDKVIKLIRWHMFFSDTETITHSAVRRLIANVGQENVWDLMSVRAADRIGTGRPKESPYRLRKYHAMIDEVMSDPVSVGMLKIDGAKLMEVTQSKPGPHIGYILHALLEEVIEDPQKNTGEYLESKAKELLALPEKELKALGEKGKETKQQEEDKKIDEIRKKHWVE
jgi:tRNA nucleotidyltransferase (CCA-adding enzyme)